jgi:hypothetical protein
LRADLLVYTNKGAEQDAVPSTEINAILDAIESALAPEPVSGFQTLGGLVSSAKIVNTEIYEGLMGSQSLTVVSLEMLVGADPYSWPGAFWFGTGTLWAVPGLSFDQETQADKTPIRIANLKGITLDAKSQVQLSRVAAALHPVMATVKQVQITGRAMIGAFDGKLLNQVFFGAQAVSGAKLISQDQAGTVPGVPGPYTISPAIPGGGSYTQDFGVLLTDTGKPLKKVSGAPAAGEYSESGGTYTFNAAQADEEVAISYSYTLSTGSALAIPNGPGARAPEFQLALRGVYNGREASLILNRVVTDDVILPTSVERFMVSDLSFTALSDASGEVGSLNLGV